MVEASCLDWSTSLCVAVVPLYNAYMTFVLISPAVALHGGRFAGD